MGNSNEYILQQLTFLQQLEDPHFGPIELYRDDNGTFLMKSKCTHIANDKRYNEFERIVEWVNTSKYRCVVPIMKKTTLNCTLTQNSEKHICVHYQVTSMYTEYFNYTLRDLLENGKMLEQGELWKVLYDLIGLASVLKENKIGINLTLDKVFLTLKGQVVVFVHHLVSFEESLCCSSYGMGQLIAKAVIQVASGTLLDQEQEDDDKIYLAPLATICSHYPLLGQTLRMLINRERPQTQILTFIDSLLTQCRIRKAFQIKLTKFKYVLPNNKKQPQLQKTAPVFEQKFNQTSLAKAVKKQLDSPRLSTDNKSLFSESKQIDNYNYEQLMTEIDRKKHQNVRNMQKFQQKKQQLTNRKQPNPGKQNKIQNRDSIGQRQSLRKGRRDERVLKKR